MDIEKVDLSGNIELPPGAEPIPTKKRQVSCNHNEYVITG